MALLVDRNAISQFIYGRGGPATANFLNNPPRYRSPNMRWEFSTPALSAGNMPLGRK